MNEIERLKLLLRECQAFLFDDSGTPIAPEDLRERVNDALQGDEPERPKSISCRIIELRQRR